MKSILVLLVLFAFPLAAQSATEVDCFLDAEKRISYNGGPSLEVYQMVLLCSGATSNKPVDCFLDARKRIVENHGVPRLSYGQMTDICRFRN